MSSVEAKVVQVAVEQVRGFVAPTDDERAAAYELLIEMSTRNVGAHLASTDGTIRDELDGIEAMFVVTRRILRRHGADAAKGSGGNLSLAVVAIRVLNEVFRPVVARWNPILRDYEARRPMTDPSMTPVEWERRWVRNEQCRSELNRMRASVRAYIDTLSRIAGASAIADAVLNAPNSVMFPTTVPDHDLRPPATPATVQPRPKMVRWFDPVELFTTWRSGLRSTSSLERLEAEPFQAPEGPDARFDAEPGADFWFDYVADSGDGFDATAPVAWLVGRERIELPDDRHGDLPTPPKYMPRADLLVFGGDEIYPFAFEGGYEAQLELPYAMGFEGTCDDDGPAMVAIPGNHDWLGGIEHFQKMFVSGRRFAGHWTTPQRNTWWHVKLPQGWWLWGIDTELHNQLIGPQQEYFAAAAEELRPGDRVILCTPVPLWQLRQKYREDYSALRAVFDPLIVGHGATMPLCLSGDSHFFAHLERLDTDFGEDHITAGGGGAFLQPTHNLPERIPQEEGNAEFRLTSRWPLPADSRAIAPPTRRLFDPQYALLMVGFALVSLLHMGLTLIRWPDELVSDVTCGDRSFATAAWWVLTSPWASLGLVVVAAAGVVAMKGNSVEPKLTSAARMYGLLVGTATAVSLAVIAIVRQFVVLRFGACDPPAGNDIGDAIVAAGADASVAGWWLWGSLAIAAPLAGVLAVAVFMAGVRWTNTRIKANDTLAFLPAVSTRYKHFLRFRIDAQGDLTCYVVGVDPVGRGWYEAMTTPSSVPPYDPAGVPRLHYVWGKTYGKFVPVPLDVAVSVSDPDDAPPRPLAEEFEQLFGILIDGGHTLMYGGVPDAGYTRRLHEIERRRHADNPNAEHHLVNYVPDYLWTKADLGDPSTVRTIRVTRAPEGDETEVEREINDLMAMRHLTTRRCDVRVVIGGALRPGAEPGRRLAPGVLEEAVHAVDVGRPLIVAGGFGGVGRLIADALLGRLDPTEVDELETHFLPVAADATDRIGFAEMLERFDSIGVLRNGLTVGENRELLRSSDANTVSELVVRSIHRIGAHGAH